MWIGVVVFVFVIVLITATQKGMGGTAVIGFGIVGAILLMGISFIFNGIGSLFVNIAAFSVDSNFWIDKSVYECRITSHWDASYNQTIEFFPYDIECITKRNDNMKYNWKIKCEDPLFINDYAVAYVKVGPIRYNTSAKLSAEERIKTAKIDKCFVRIEKACKTVDIQLSLLVNYVKSLLIMQAHFFELVFK